MTTSELASELVGIAARLRSLSYAMDFTNPRQSAASTALDIASSAVFAAAFRVNTDAAERADNARAAGDRGPSPVIESDVS